MRRTHRTLGPAPRDGDAYAPLSSLPFAALLVRGSGEIVHANAASEQLLRTGDATIVGHRLAELLDAASDAAAPAAASTLGLPLSGSGPVRVRRPGDTCEALELELTLNPVEPPGRDLLLALVREAPGLSDLERHSIVARQMRAAARAAARIAARAEQPKVLDTVVEVLVEDFGAPLCRIWLLDEAREALWLRARAGIAEGGPADTIALGADCPIAHAAASGVPVVRGALHEYRSLPGGWLRRHQLGAVAALPLIHRDAVLGVLGCFLPAAPSSELQEVLIDFAAMTAACIQEAKLLPREQSVRGQADTSARWLLFEREVAEARAGELTAANRALEVERRELRNAKRRLTAQYAVLEALTRSRDLAEAAPRVLEAIGTTMRWQVGSYWAQDADGQLRAEHFWQMAGPDVDAFLERSRKMQYAVGEGLVGRVFQTGEPAWISDARRNVHFRRGELAAREGLVGALWFPVRTGNEVFGVIEFLRTDGEAPDEETLQALAALGYQIGQFAERVRAEHELAEGEERLKTTLAQPR